MREVTTFSRLLIILTLLILVEAAEFHPVNASAAVLVYDHGFAKQISWTARRGHFGSVNKTSAFTQDDRMIYAYVTATLYSANFTWQWYDPNGMLYSNRTDTEQCAVERCTFVYYFPLAGTPASTTPGLWRMDLLADGFRLYSDYFSITPVIVQDLYWNFEVIQSAPASVRGNLTITIHPDNQTWSSYIISLPYAANITAFDYASKQPLSVMTFNQSSRVIVDLGTDRSDGYAFVLSFDFAYGLHTLNGWDGGTFAFTWLEEPWERFSAIHPTPETFNITLPENATLVDAVGINTMTLNYNPKDESRSSVSINSWIPSRQRFGWTIIFRDLTYQKSHLPPVPRRSVLVGFMMISQQSTPILPLTLGGASLWTAIMSVFLLAVSELLSPIYARASILIDRRRLRIAALILVTLFLAITAYQVVVSQYFVSQ